MQESKPKITVVICGGGVKGTFQAGFLYALLTDDHYEVEKVYASSIGAVLAPFVAANRPEYLKEFCFKLTKLETYFEKWWLPAWICSFWTLGFFKKNNLASHAWKYFDATDIGVIESKCNIVAWNVLKNCEEWFTGQYVRDGITASSSLWLLVPPFKLNNQYYLDGGCRNIYPIDILLNNSDNKNPIDKIFFLDSSTRICKEKAKLPRNAIQLLYQLHDSTLEDYGRLKLELLEEKYGESLLIIRPDEDIFDSNVDFNIKKMEASFKHGENIYWELVHQSRP